MSRFFLPILVSSLLLASCRFGGNHQVRGNGTIRTETRTTSSFNRIDVGGNLDVMVKQDSTSSVRIEADENLMSHIIVRTEGDELVIEPRNGENLRGSKPIRIYVSAPYFSHLEASGASSLTGESVLSGEKIRIELSGASAASLELNAPAVSADVEGASHLNLKGRTKDLSIEASGASHIKAYELLSEQADVDVSGASSAEVFASITIKCDASGASHIRYKGAAAQTGSSSGAGSISKVE